jgi:P27 family predicted phage terminase small subunit
MTAGRPPEPIEVQQLKAKGDGTTPGHRKVTEVTTQAGSELVPFKKSRGGGVDKRRIPKIPTHLQKRGRFEWFKIWETGSNWLRPHEDYRQVEMIASAFDEIEAMRAQIAETGMMVPSPYNPNVTVANPLYAEVNKRQMLILKCLESLGFSPTARRKLAIGDVQLATGLMDFEERVAAKQAKDTKAPTTIKMSADGTMEW